MSLGREEAGVEAWTCESCKRALTPDERRKTGYSGTLLLPAWMRKRKQEVA